MSRESEKFGDISSASSIIFFGRGTSTPIDTTQPPEGCTDLIFRNSDARAKKSLDFLHPAIEYANKPIFGRRNLQLLSDCANQAANGASEPDFSLGAGETTIKFSIEPITDTDPSKIKSKGSVKTSKKVRGTSESQVSAVKASKNRRSITVSSTNKRRSNQSNPVFKVTPKCSKSPRRLTKIRAKAKERRERRSIGKKEEEKSDILVRQNGAENEKYVGTIPKCPKIHIQRSVDTQTELKIKESVSKHTNGSEKEKTKPFKSSLLSSSGIRKKTDNKKKIYKGSALSEYFKDLKYKEKSNVDLEKLVVFKAGPIRTYTPVQPVKPRHITLPQTPKIGQRHRLHSCPR